VSDAAPQAAPLLPVSPEVGLISHRIQDVGDHEPEPRPRTWLRSMLLPLAVAVARPGPGDLAHLVENARDAILFFLVSDVKEEAAIILVQLDGSDQFLASFPPQLHYLHGNPPSTKMLRTKADPIGKRAGLAPSAGSVACSVRLDAMDEAAIKDFVKVWEWRSRTERDFFARFAFQWLCFNAWLAFESGEDRDWRMIKWLKSPSAEGSKVKLAFDRARKSDHFIQYIQTLVNAGPIEHSRREEPAIVIADVDDFAGMLEAIYQIRCRFFHGLMPLRAARSDQLIRPIVRILEPWLGNLRVSLD